MDRVTNILYKTGNGSLIQGLEYEYDSIDRLVGETTSSVGSSVFDIQYSYDVLGRKASRTKGRNVEHYVYDGQQIVADLDASGNLLRTYVWGTGIDNLLSFTDHTTTNTYYPIKDHQNTILSLVDSTGTVVVKGVNLLKLESRVFWNKTKERVMMFSKINRLVPFSGRSRSHRK